MRLASQHRLVAYGGRCVGPIVDTLEEESPWTRSTVALPGVLGKIGEDAHRGLIEEVDRTTDPNARAFLVSSLQGGFQDWSRFHLVLADATEGRLSEWALTNVMREFRGRHPDAPELSSDDPAALLEWWSDQAAIVVPADPHE